MNQESIKNQPILYAAIKEATMASGFTMPSEIMTCSLLRTLAASKPGGKFLELGTGTGLSAAWIIDGMDGSSKLITVDNDAQVQGIAQKYLDDDRLSVVCQDGNEWLAQNAGQKFDFIFADAWPGKYSSLNVALCMLEKGGIYIIDDMLPQPNWPDGHQQKVDDLLEFLESRDDIVLTKQEWASGMVICVKK